MDEQGGKMGNGRIRMIAMVAAVVVIAAVAGFIALRRHGKQQASAAALQGAAHSTTDLAARNATAVAQPTHVAGSENVSIDGGHSSANVVYAPRVKMFEHNEIQSSLQGISSDGHGFIFQNAGPKILALQAGDIMMVKGEMAAKVLGMVTDQGQTLVLVDRATLHELLSSGQINMDIPVRFHGPKRTASLERPNFDMPGLHPPSSLPASFSTQGLGSHIMDLLDRPVYAQQIPQLAPGTKISGWTVAKWSIVAGDNEADYDLVMVKSEAGFEAWIGIKGWIGSFNISSNLKLDAGNAGMLESLAAKASNLSGFATVEWEVGKSTPGPWATEDRVKLPAGISIPLAPVLEGLPLTLDISTAVLIHPGLTGNNEFAHGGFNVSFSGDGNFQSPSSGSVAGLGTMSIKDQITVSESISPIGPNAMLIALCAPRIELQLDVMGPFAGALGSYGGIADKGYNYLLGKLSPNIQNQVANSPLSKMTPSNVLKSNADVYLEFVVTGAVTNAAQESLFQCTSTTIVYTFKAGAAADLFGLTDGALAERVIYNHGDRFWNPPSEACEKNSS